VGRSGAGVVNNLRANEKYVVSLRDASRHTLVYSHSASNAIKGFTMTQVTRVLSCHENVAQEWMAAARRVMAHAAVQIQRRYVFGQRSDTLTIDVEADETVFAKWKEVREGQPTRYFWWVWLGIQVRGVPESLFLRDCGVRTSLADAKGVARPPQISVKEWLAALDEAGFCAETRAVLMTDAAPTFVHTGHPGIQYCETAPDPRSTAAIANLNYV
jgi:hypothetical protein